jgi:hypothetical protein
MELSLQSYPLADQSNDDNCRSRLRRGLTARAGRGRGSPLDSNSATPQLGFFIIVKLGARYLRPRLPGERCKSVVFQSRNKPAARLVEGVIDDRAGNSQSETTPADRYRNGLRGQRRKHVFLAIGT